MTKDFYATSEREALAILNKHMARGFSGWIGHVGYTFRIRVWK